MWAWRLWKDGRIHLREQGTGNREQGTGNREQGTGSCVAQASCLFYQQPNSDSRFPIPDSRLPFPSWEGLGVGSDSRLNSENNLYYQVIIV
ncbi:MULTISPECIES: hypothetical protein [unclassified Moorena]|uniref:hypothetical protein n=1 Tax=unclassified Moorena TaxID=2683338 RepID=UPI0013C6A464|nr:MULTISPECIES: hypothetical protein [unclassified Moorena]NEO23058.1 hypothetical protein [Moorena sp. SIO4A5]NEQ61921.1 hypothetical protein [Moorena sp. SIO4A1]